jgi:hypothetical protein
VSGPDDLVLHALQDLTAGPLPGIDLDAVVRRARARRTRRWLGTAVGVALVIGVGGLGVAHVAGAHQHGHAITLNEASATALRSAPAPMVPHWMKREPVPFTPVLFGTDSGSVDLTVLLDDGAYVQVASWATSSATVSASNPTAADAARAAFDPATGDAHAEVDSYTRLLTGIVPASVPQVTVSGTLGHVVVPTYPIPGYAVRVFVVPAAGVSAGRWSSDYFVSTDVDGSHLLTIGQRVG